ncbi:MAG: hypothetical protein AABX00_05440 [Nanoarchaeota archaeon]
MAWEWFFGKGIFIDSISLVVMLLIALSATKYYFVKKSRNYLFLALSFYSMALAFLSKILITFTINYKVLYTEAVRSMQYTTTIVKSSEVLSISGDLFYRIFTLVGLFLLYSIYEKQSKANIILMAYLLSLSALFTKDQYPLYYLFYLTTFLFFGIISHRYYRNYRENKEKTTGMLAASFSIITLSQLLFLLKIASKSFYFAGEIVQLVGYTLLLVTFIMVLKHGRKKNKN